MAEYGGHGSLLQSAQLWKTVRWEFPAHFNGLITLDEEDKLSTVRPRLQLTETSFIHKSINTWNLLPLHIRTETRLARFKSSVKEWLKERRHGLNRDDDIPLVAGTRPPDVQPEN